MKGILKSEKRVCLFVCGFMIGIFLEIILIEREKFKFLEKHESLERPVQVSCLILLKHKHMRYVNTSEKTWLNRCNEYFIVDIKRSQNTGSELKSETFLSQEQDNRTCSKNGKNFKGFWEIGGKSAWSGLCRALHITYSNLSEWLIIVPDSSLVLIENLQLFVKDLNSDDGHYFGYGLENYEANYNTLSAGILLSRGAVKKLLGMFKTTEDCDRSGKYWKNEDLYLGKYLKQLDIYPKDTRDKDGRGRFHGYNMNNVLWPGKLFALSDYSKKALFPVSKGYNCCSSFMITTDVSDPDAMYNLYYLLYKLTSVHKKVPKQVEAKKNDDSVWKDFLRKEGYNESYIESMSSEEYFEIWKKKLPLDSIYQQMENFLKNRKELD